MSEPTTWEIMLKETSYWFTLVASLQLRQCVVHIFKLFFQFLVKDHLISWGRADAINSFTPVQYPFQQYFLIRNRNKDQNKSVIKLEIWSKAAPAALLLSLSLLLLFKIVLSMMCLCDSKWNWISCFSISVTIILGEWWGSDRICRFVFVCLLGH